MSAHVLVLCHGALVLLLVAAAIADSVSFTIPNSISAALVMLFPIAAAFSPEPVAWVAHLAAAALVFAVGILAFRMRLLGGGDVKLWSAAALWAGLDFLAAQVVLTAAIGGMLALLLVMARQSAGRLTRFKMPSGQAVPCPRILTNGAPVPYGVAIASGSVLLSLLPGVMP